jgi:ribosomal protein L11 methyltransferase
MTQNYFAVTVKTGEKAIEAVEFALSEAGAEGTELDLLGKKQTKDNVSVVGYFTWQPDEEIVQSWLTSALEIYELPADSIAVVETRRVENLDWLAEWKKHWRPTETGKFIVAPSWFELPERGNKIVLRIEPGMAFGTGTHETTRLCLQAIEENFNAGTFLDVGTGTGVLAIAARLLSIENSHFALPQIEGCDTDLDSVKIAIENAEINNVADKIKFYVGSIDENTPQFDFVVANLTADVIIPLLPLLTRKFRKTLVLSGILSEQQDSVESDLRKLLAVNLESEIWNLEFTRQGEWISIVINNA